MVDNKFIKRRKVPDYIHAHAYGTETTEKVRREIAVKCDQPYTETTMKLLCGKKVPLEWYIFGSPEAQLKENLASYLVENKAEFDMEVYGYIRTYFIQILVRNILIGNDEKKDRMSD